MEEILKYINEVFDITAKDRFTENDARNAIVRLAMAVKTVANIYLDEQGDLK